MKEIKAIISTYDQLDKSKTQAALATVVRVEGSSYRRTGARMLVMDDGIWVGGISGGCLEGDALRRARMAIVKSQSSLVTYDTSESDAYQIGVGLGCNGIIDVLFTPLDFSDPNNPVEILRSCTDGHRQKHILITITGLDAEWNNIHSGTIFEYSSPKDLERFNDQEFQIQFQDALSKLVAAGKSAPLQVQAVDGRFVSAFIEILLPDIHIVLMGHQYDIYPLARISRELAWKVSIVANPLKLNSKLLNSEDQLFGNDQFDRLVTDQYTGIVLMSHDFKVDQLNLPKAIATNAGYIGLLGPKVRAERMLSELAEEGFVMTPDNKQRIYAPAGLDIGALTPEEIALSLIAEIRAVFSNREGGSLRSRNTTIHERT